MTKTAKLNYLVILKEEVEGMWERLVAANSNAAAGSRFHQNLSTGNLGFVYNQVKLFRLLQD